MNPKLGHWWASPDTGWKYFIVQQPGSNSSVKDRLLAIDCCSVYWCGKNSQTIYFSDSLMSSFTRRVLGHICDICTEFNQSLVLVYSQYTTNEKNVSRNICVSSSEGALQISNMGETKAILRMLAVLFSGTRTTTYETTQTSDTNRKWTREDNKFTLHCYFRNSPAQRGYRRRMIEICEECTRFQTTSQRLVDQVRIIIKKILEIHQKINRESRKQDPTNYWKCKNNLSEMNRKQSKYHTLKLHRTNTKTRKRNEYRKLCRKKKTTLPSLKNQDWRTVKTETWK